MAHLTQLLSLLSLRTLVGSRVLPSVAPPIEFTSANGAYFTSGDGAYFGTAS